MNYEWTIDTCLFYAVGKNETDAITLLMNILHNNDRISVDIQRNIEREYRTCLEVMEREKRTYPGCELSKILFGKFVSRSFKIYDGSLTRRQKRELDRLVFDPDDRKFVAVCFRSKNKTLVTEDSDYNENIKQFLEGNMSITVLCVKDACDRFFGSV